MVSIPPPQAYPPPGTYDWPQIITLMSSTSNAVIHYTCDGSIPTTLSPVFDPYRLVPMVEFGQEVPPGISKFTIRAITVVDGNVSEVGSLLYEISPRAKEDYISHELSPGLRMIRDYENDKMYLVIGKNRALLIDAGMGSGDLRRHIEAFTNGLPIDLVITHGHPDHVAKIGQFQSDCRVFMHHEDIPLVKRFIERFHYDIDLEKMFDIREGFLFDLGDRVLQVFELPGHSKGSIVLFDEANGILFSGDAVGSNRPTIVDALWMQMSETMIDEYLSILQNFRSKIKGKIKLIYGGHNDTGFIGEKYLDSLQKAAEKLIDEGPSILVPSPRPSGAWQVVYGNRMTDPNWAAINVNPEKCLTTSPEKIATLSSLEVKGGFLTPAFHPTILRYLLHQENESSQISLIPTATSRRYSWLKMNDVDFCSGEAFSVTVYPDGSDQIISINISSPDESTTNTYTLAIN